MSAPPGGPAGQRGTNAQDLLAELLTEPEHIAVLKYSQEHNLESDSDVFFIVAMLKLYAFVYDRMSHMAKKAEEAPRVIHAAVIQAESNLRDSIEGETAVLKKLFADQVASIALYANQFSEVTGELKMMTGILQKATRDATSAYRAYEAIKDDGTGSTLSRIFHDQAKAAIDRRIPLYDDTLRLLIQKMIAREFRKTSILVGAVLAFQVAFVILIR